MKRLYIGLIVVSLVLLGGCDTPSTPTPVPTTSTVNTTATQPAVVTTAAQAPHSPLFLPDVGVEDVITYFNEVCLDAEFVNSGDATRLQKWTTPLRYRLHGDYTSDDLAVLAAFETQLNTIDGFPGIAHAADDESANMNIHFCTQSDMQDLLGESFVNMDGGVTFWYDNNQIYNAVICYRTDIDQTVRNSVILEEIYNGLGPIQDTSLRQDSIIYSEFSTPQALTEIDELLLKLLYHPQMQCGMTAAECETVIRELYY